jgi:hypothetical protein
MKYCNLKYLRDVSPKSNSFAVEMISLFLKDTPDAIKNMKEAANNEKYFEIYKNGIKIKPSFQMLGLPSDLFNYLTEILELSNAMKDLDKIKYRLESIERGLVPVYKELEQEVFALKN